LEGVVLLGEVSLFSDTDLFGDLSVE